VIPRRLLTWRALLLAAAAVCAVPAQASRPGLDEQATSSPALATALQTELARELPGPCEGEQCGALEVPQPETRVRGFELDLYCRLGGEDGLSCRPRRVWLEEYGEGASDRLVYAKARYFDPELGRFLSQDSYLGELTEPPSLHRYLYAWDRPTYWADPTGHAPEMSLAEAAERERQRRAGLSERGPAFESDQGGQIVSADGPAVVPNRGATGGAMSEDELRLDPELRRRFAEAKAKGGGMPDASPSQGEQIGEPISEVEARAQDIHSSKAEVLRFARETSGTAASVSRGGLEMIPGAEAVKFVAGEDFEGHKIQRANAAAGMIIATVGSVVVVKVGGVVVKVLEARSPAIARQLARFLGHHADDGEAGAAAARRSSNTTRRGVARNNPADMREWVDTWDRTGVDAFSDANRAAIKARRNPVVDEQWVKQFPGDAQLLGEPIRIHHIEGTNINVPLPVSRHKDAHMPGGFRYNPGGPGTSG